MLPPSEILASLALKGTLRPRSGFCGDRLRSHVSSRRHPDAQGVPPVRTRLIPLFSLTAALITLAGCAEEKSVFPFPPPGCASREHGERRLINESRVPGSERCVWRGRKPAERRVDEEGWTRVERERTAPDGGGNRSRRLQHARDDRCSAEILGDALVRGFGHIPEESGPVCRHAHGAHPGRLPGNGAASRPERWPGAALPGHRSRLLQNAGARGLHHVAEVLVLQRTLLECPLLERAQEPALEFPEV